MSLLASLALALLLPPLPAPAAQGQEPPAAERPADARPVDELLAEGRRLLALGRPAAAEPLFELAEAREPGLRTRLWLLRAWMDQPGRSNDTLDAIDALARAHDGPELDYLYGMAFARRADQQIAQGLGTSVQMNLQDAVARLERATTAEPERFADAWPALARAAWLVQDLETARRAAEEAVRRGPEDVEARMQLGRVALSQHVAARGDGSEAGGGADDEAGRHWETARDAFERAIELAGTPEGDDARRRLAEAWLQLGHVRAWRELADAARDAYAEALGWAPEAVDLASLHGSLGDEGLREVLEAGVERFDARHGEDDASDAPMRWWLGYTRWQARERDLAEQAFLEALADAPGYANAWAYVAIARYDRQDHDGAIEALRRGWETDAAAVVAELPRFQLAKLEFLIGHAVQQGRLDDAILVGEVLAETVRDDPRHWNNLGLFLRDRGEELVRSRAEDAAARAPALYERSLRAYERALALEPDDPSYLNDTAVILHYYLDRDLERAREMYVRAAERAEALLETALPPEREELVRIARRDARNNLRALEAELRERAEAAARAAAEAAEAAEEAEGEEAGGEGEGGGEGGGSTPR